MIFNCHRAVHTFVGHIARTQTLLLALILLSCPVLTPVWAAPVAQIDGVVGGTKFSVMEPLTFKESIARMQDPTASVPTEFGVNLVDSRIGFSQLVNRADGSSLVMKLALPGEIARSLKPGTYDLGNTAVEHNEQGWSSECPDLDEDKLLFSVTYYGRAVQNGMPRILNIPAGDFVSYEQTHHTRIRRDKAVLIIKSIDPALHFIEGEMHGEISSVVARDSQEANSHKPLKWMCNPAEFIVKVETFEVRFKLHMVKH
jgi:hypothetical protein